MFNEFKHGTFVEFYGLTEEEASDPLERHLTLLKFKNIAFGKGSPPPPPDPNPGMIENAEAARDIAKIQQDTAYEFLNFSKEQYEELKPIYMGLFEAQKGIMEDNRARADAYAEYEANTFRPLEQSLVDAAQKFDTKEKREELATRAGADVTQQFGIARQQLNRQLQSQGLKPNAGRMQALNRDLVMGEALGRADQMNKSRIQSEALGYAKLQDAAALGRGLASNASTAYGVSLNAGQGAGGSAGAAANYMGSAYNQTGQMMNNATNAYGVAGNIYGQEFNARMQGYNAQLAADANSSSGLGSLVGMGLSTFGGANGWGTAMMAASDRRMKTDIEKVGKDKASGLDLYAYRYKGDPKTYPKVIGPMADEVEEKYPEKVVEVAGKKAIKLADGGSPRHISDGSKPIDARRGGGIKGPGTTTSDDIPAMLSNGEYVIPADVVSKMGVKHFDNILKKHHTPAAEQEKKPKKMRRRALRRT